MEPACGLNVGADESHEKSEFARVEALLELRELGALLHLPGAMYASRHISQLAHACCRLI